MSISNLDFETSSLFLQVKCDAIPASATLHCNSPENPCLFHIPKDPCEYYNLASIYPRYVSLMMAKLRIYNLTVLPPRRRPYDPKANPKFWGNSWTNWLDYPPPLSPEDEDNLSSNLDYLCNADILMK